MRRTPRLPSVGLIVAASLLPLAPLAAQVRETGAVAGLVVERESGAPLPYGVVSIPSLGVERIFGERGTFTLHGLAPGRHLVRVRRLGFSPAQLEVEVRAGRTDTMRVVLDRIATRLATVRVSALLECSNPGLPSASVDAPLADAMTQLLMNAEQYRVLTRSYPFTYTMLEQRTMQLRSGSRRTARADTLVIASDVNRRYGPGRVLVWEYEGMRDSTLRFQIPTLTELADPGFLDSHCFSAAGMERVAGLGDGALFRIDFMADRALRDPDVHGSIYLDPDNFQIRRTVLRLSRMPRDMHLRSMEVTTDFQELFPSVPIIGTVSAQMRYDAPGRNVLESEVTRQRTIAHAFRGARPGDERQTP